MRSLLQRLLKPEPKQNEELFINTVIPNENRRFTAQQLEDRLQALEAHQAARTDALEARLVVAETELAYAIEAPTKTREVW